MKIFEKEEKEFEELWRKYHVRNNISYSYDDMEEFFKQLILIFREGHGE
jgi:restriction endonuclease